MTMRYIGANKVIKNTKINKPRRTRQRFRASIPYPPKVIPTQLYASFKIFSPTSPYHSFTRF